MIDPQCECTTTTKVDDVCLPFGTLCSNGHEHPFQQATKHPTAETRLHLHSVPLDVNISDLFHTWLDLIISSHPLKVSHNLNSLTKLHVYLLGTILSLIYQLIDSFTTGKLLFSTTIKNIYI